MNRECVDTKVRPLAAKEDVRKVWTTHFKFVESHGKYGRIVCPHNT